ncbi:MAG: Phosphoribosylanthranilate isomerase [Myxococcaceae bacterium]|nr:Phosphoribosylanthranilate isomerase [Myxococcaceae bacterium]
MIRVKICGITAPEDALVCADAGADAIGLNFVPTSRRCVTREEAREVLRAVRGRGIETVAVVADLDADTLRELADEVDVLQLHGNESPSALLQLLPRAYKAVRVDAAADVLLANTYAGERILVDAKVPYALGGTGVSFDWSLVTELAKNRRLILAGGLSPENVERAVRVVRPWCVDVASGVDLSGDPRRKDAALVKSFIARARGA